LGVRALDPLTLEVNLVGPTGHFPQMLTQWPFYPIPRHVVAAHGENWTRPEHIVTNGPFTLAGWEPDRLIRLQRNPAYRGDFSGNLAEVEVALGLSPVEQVEHYRTNRLDMLSLYPLSFNLDMMRHRHAAEYFSGPILHTQYLWFNIERPPFNDIRVRRAFTMAIDREYLAGVVLSGYAYPATGGFIPPSLPEHSPDIGLPYDLEQARRLLAEAGYQKDNPIFILTGLCKPGHGPEYQYLQEQWQQQLGVSITWTNLEWNHLLQRLDQEPPHMFMMGWSADYPDPDNLLRVGAYQKILSHWYNDRFAQLVEQARRTTDRAERLDLYRQADKLLIEEAAIVPLFYNKGHALLKPWVRKYPTSPVNWYYWKDVILDPH
jgi:oligopeptide transport system substrate-binding protein